MGRLSKKGKYMRGVDIEEYMKQGISRIEIARRLCDKWECSEKSILRQYDEIMHQMVSEAASHKDSALPVILSRNEEILKNAMAEKKWKIALDANMAQAKIFGLLDPKKDQVEDTQPKMIRVTEQDKDSNLVELIKKNNE